MDTELLQPRKIIKRYELPKPLLDTATHEGKLPAYNVGTAKKPRYMGRLPDLEQWLESFKIGKK